MKTVEKAEAKWTRIKSIIDPPPIGLMPEYLWKAKRMCDIYGAVKRYKDAGYDIPYEWLEEFKRLDKELSRRYNVAKLSDEEWKRLEEEFLND